MKTLRHIRVAPVATVVGGPRWNRILERQKHSTEAMTVVRPFNDALAALTAQIDELDGALDRGGNGVRLCDKAHRLSRAVYCQQIAFADATRPLAPPVAANDRISTTREALDGAAVAIEKIEKAIAKDRHDACRGRATAVA